MIRIKIVFICIYLLLSSKMLNAQRQVSIDSLQLALKESNNVNKVVHFLNLADYYAHINIKNVDSIRYYASKVLNSKDEWRKPEQTIDALYLLGRADSYVENYDKAIKRMEEVIEKSKEIIYDIGLRKANSELGSIYTRNKENLKGISHYERAFELAQSNNESEDIILDLMVSLCLEYIRINDLEKTSELLEKTVMVINKPSVSENTKCLFHLNAALFYSDFKDNEKSLTHFNTALEIAKKSNNKRFQSAALINIGSIYASTYNDYEKSNSYYYKALDIIKTDSLLNSGAHKGNVLYYLGYNNYYAKAYKKAISHLEESLPILKNSDELSHIYSIMYLGYAYKKINQFHKSNNNFKTASSSFLKMIDELKKDGNPKVLISDIYRNLSTIDSTLGNFKRSLGYYKLHTVYKDSVAEETNLKITERLDFVEQTAKKNQEIIELNAESKFQRHEAELQKSQKKWLLFILVLVVLFAGIVLYGFSEKKKGLKIINEKNEENKLLMKEIHHRVKNNLQIILSLLNAQIDGNQSDKKLRDVLTESLNKIKSMAIIHNSLYQGNQFTKVCANSYINELIHNLNKSFENKSEKIKFEIDVDKKQIKMGLAIPLGLIVNELITNSHKYAFNDSTKENNVKISFKQIDQSNRFQLIIQDNGIGLPEDFNIDELSSFGIQLVQGLVDQLHGNIEINQDKGTTFQIYVEEPIAA